MPLPIISVVYLNLNCSSLHVISTVISRFSLDALIEFNWINSPSHLCHLSRMSEKMKIFAAGEALARLA